MADERQRELRETVRSVIREELQLNSTSHGTLFRRAQDLIRSRSTEMVAELSGILSERIFRTHFYNNNKKDDFQSNE